MNTRNDRSIRILLGVIAFLLAGNLLVQINYSGESRMRGRAGIPDAGAQAQAQIDQLVDLNHRVDKLQSFLESGNLAVKTKETKPEK